jgi:excisionase family DNA binding protein
MCEKAQTILTVEEMRQILKIGTNSAYNLIHSGAFPVIRIGQTYRIPAEPFYAWLGNPGAAVHSVKSSI